ncbi:MAG: PAS domain S-box protein [Jaaginema sp. PMC 1079.18]|nr:PAS domain S-box protein [Jaaginema sp. PMC 1080.18]MEC4850778.1 PAS domain S-box protein [Jaaginema sp. PMC 1079.18]MEC4867004.1 PAS domain S-box protein [Jaaginema sp. PMC 1078.18]
MLRLNASQQNEPFNTSGDRVSLEILNDPDTQQLFESAIDAIAIVDNQGYFLDVNPAACQLLKRQKVDIVDRCLVEFVKDPADFEVQWQRLNKLLQSNLYFSYSKNGAEFLIEYTQHIHLNSQSYLAIFRDITESHIAQSQIQQLTQKLTANSEYSCIPSTGANLAQDYHLKQIVRHIPGIIYQFRQRIDGTVHFPYVSEGIQQFHGCSPEEVREDGTKMFEFIHPDDLEKIIQSTQESATNLTPWYCEYRTCLPNGQQFWLLGHSTPQKAPDGSITWYGFIKNITARKRAELELKEREEHFRGIIENLDDMVYVVNADTTFSYVSPQFRDIMGYKLSELRGTSFAEFVHSDDLPICTNALKQTFQGEKIRGIEYRVLHKDGSYYWHKSNVSALKDDQGNIIACLGIGSYIHDQKQKDILIQKIQQQYYTLTENSPIGIFLTDASGNCSYVNKAYTEITGISQEEALDLGWSQTLHPEDKQKLFQEWYNSTFAKKEFRLEYRFLRADNSVKCVLGQGLPWIANGEVEGYVGTVVDISDRKHQEEALRLIVEGTAAKTGSDFFRSCVQYLAQVLQVRYGLISEFIGENKQQAQTLALWTGDGFGENYTYDLAETPCETTKYGDEIRRYCSNIQVKFPEDKDLVTLQAESYAGVAIKDAAGNQLGVLAVFDTKPMQENFETQSSILQIFAIRIGVELERLQAETALRKSENHLRQQTQALEKTLSQLQTTQAQLIQAEKMSSLGQLVAGVAHEINNPVSFIYSNIQPADTYSQDLISLIYKYQQHYPSPPAEIEDLIEDIDFEYIVNDFPKLLNSMQTGANRIRDIVKSLRTFSRLDEADLKATDLYENMESTLVILQNRFNGRDGNPATSLVKKYDDLPLVNCYGGLLNQVFMNLLVNALDAIDMHRQNLSNPDKKDYCGEITIETQMTADERVLITIRDNGCGMSPQVKEKIFNPFFTTKAIGKGTGMGLAISYQIVTENHGGTLQCESIPGVGTEFAIALPTNLITS